MTKLLPGRRHGQFERVLSPALNVVGNGVSSSPPWAAWAGSPHLRLLIHSNLVSVAMPAGIPG